VVVIALATALSTPLVLANPSIASGLWGTSLVPRTRPYLEAEMRFRPSTIKTEAEVEFGQGTFNGVAKTKLGAAVEMLLVNPTSAPDATSIDATIHLGTATCTFTNDPRVTGPFTIVSRHSTECSFRDRCRNLELILWFQKVSIAAGRFLQSRSETPLLPISPGFPRALRYQL